VLTSIVSSKTTVLGLRLDHDRRAWVEATAARRGTTVRGFFEVLIDRARIEDEGGGHQRTRDDEPDEAGRWDQPGDRAPAGAGADAGLGAPGGRDRFGSGPPASGWPGFDSLSDLRRVVSVPGQMIGTAASVSAALLESGGRCIRETWRLVAETLRQGHAPSSAYPPRSDEP
jgi:hypothetical protein